MNQLRQIGDEGILTIEHTDSPETRLITYTTAITEYRGEVKAHAALQLEQSDIILQPDGVTNVLHEVMRLLDN